MIIRDDFGCNVLGDSVGTLWLDLVSAIVEYGETTFDEGRKRLSLQNVRVKSRRINESDEIIDKYASKENIADILKLTFEEPVMYDIDVNPSFSTGAKSYYQRLEESRAIDFVVDRLSLIPESKKAVVVFPNKDDYASVLKNPWNDYLPCIVAVQFRMVPNGGSGRYKLNTVFFARSIDAYQKSIGNLVALAHMSEIVRDKITAKTGREIALGELDGFVTDAHIYEENFDDARSLTEKAKLV